MAHTTPSNQPKLDIPKLQKNFSGQLITPNDSEYNTLRTVFPGGIDRKPALIILVENAADIQQAVKLAKETGLPLAIRSGGHSSVGHCVCDDGIVLDLRRMKATEFDLKNQTVWAETGLTASELTKAADAHQLVIGFGDTGSVGIGGITLNGGVGYLVRQFGLTIDNLLAAEIVTADGELLLVDAEHHPDLFWAIRGGGGNFGVVVRFKYQLHHLPEAVGGLLFLPAEPAVLTKFIALAEQAPNALSSIVNVMPAPPMPMIPAEYHGKLIVMALMMYAGPAADAAAALAPFRAITKPLADLLRPMRYAEIFFPDDGSYHPTAVGETFFMSGVDAPLAETIIKHLNASDATMSVVQLRVLGGAMAKVPVAATAFAHRQSRIMANVAAFYTTAEDKKVRQAWVQKLSGSLRQDVSSAYVGFINTADGSQIHEAYPDKTWQRLATIKHRYDPTNLFRLNQNIEPAKG